MLHYRFQHLGYSTDNNYFVVTPTDTTSYTSYGFCTLENSNYCMLLAASIVNKSPFTARPPKLQAVYFRILQPKRERTPPFCSRNLTLLVLFVLQQSNFANILKIIYC